MDVLVADDDSVMRTMVKRLVESWDYRCMTAADGNEAWLKLQGPNAPSLAILDWEMPGMNGVTIASRLRASGQMDTYTYLLLVTSRSAKNVFEALTSGADDYLTKPFDPQELRARLHVGTRIVSLQRELVAAYEAAKYQASHDYLTGLLNRRLLVDFAQQELERARRAAGSMAAILCDVDHFKRVNDTLGHQAGDHVLIEVARRIRSATRTYDHVGRYGGEEFLVIAADCDAEQAGVLAERIRETVANRPVDLGGASCPATVSLGVAVSGPGTSVDEMLAAADAALYVAKDKGRNRWEIAKPGVVENEAGTRDLRPA